MSEHHHSHGDHGHGDHDHDHVHGLLHHHHDHASAPERALWVAIVLNGAFLVVEIVVADFGGAGERLRQAAPEKVAELSNRGLARRARPAREVSAPLIVRTPEPRGYSCGR